MFCFHVIIFLPLLAPTIIGETAEEAIDRIDFPTMPTLTLVPEFQDIVVSNDSDLIAQPWMIERISEYQDVAVKLRNHYVERLRAGALWACDWIEVNMPSHYHCVMKTLQRILPSAVEDFPPELLDNIRNVKELLLKSQKDQTPIRNLYGYLKNGLETYLNRIPKKLKALREVLNVMLTDKMAAQFEYARIRCVVEDYDVDVPERNTGIIIPDPAYVFTEDYETIDYKVAAV